MLTRWNDFEHTFSLMNDLRKRMDRVFGESELGASRSLATGPRVAFWDDTSRLVLLADVPGLTEKDLKITVTGDTLSVEGERRTQVPEGYSVHRQERGSMRFARTFQLPCKVDVERTTATVRNGVLTIELPKAPEAQPRQIMVRTG